MIITVTMNPAIDKTVDIQSFIHGGLNRITRTCQDAGGKGINVSKTIRHLGGETVAAGFVAGSTGEFIEKALKEYGIRTDFIPVEGETRTNTKIVETAGTVTELNEPGPEVTKEHVEKLIQKLEEYASPDTLVVLSGSIPRGVDRNIYGVITERMHERGASVLLDADGGLFAQSLYAAPDIVKPNRVELEQYFGQPDAKEKDLIRMGEELLEKGIQLVAISMGSEGALFLKKGCRIKCPGLQVKAHSTVGAGDAMVAALAMAWQQHLPFEKAAALGMATSAGAVTTIGTKPPTKEVVETLLGQVQIQYI